MTGEACGYQTFKIDSEDSENQTFEVRTSGDIITDMLVGEDFIVYLPACGGERVLPEDPNLELASDEPFENPDPDFLGPDSYSDFIFDCDSDEKIYDDPLEVAAWVGPGNQNIKTTADATTNHHGSGAYDTSIRTSVHAKICVYFECIPYLCINGTKINDCDGSGIEGWEICLTKPNGETICTTTDANGDYSFCKLVPGSYKVCEKDKAGWVHLDEPCRDVTLVDESAEGVDFLNEPTFCISGHKFNSNTGEGLSGWTINLEDLNGAVIKTTTTGTDGYYEFCNLIPGDYVVCEVMKPDWKAVGPICIVVTLDCANSENNDFENEPIINPPCGSGCQWFIKNEPYTATSGVVKFVDASKGILANDPDGTIVVDPESITIDPKYGTIEVYEDGSFEYNPTVATGLYSGVYVIFKYKANNGLCDAKYLGIAKIQVR